MPARWWLTPATDARRSRATCRRHAATRGRARRRRSLPRPRRSHGAARTGRISARAGDAPDRSWSPADDGEVFLPTSRMARRTAATATVTVSPTLPVNVASLPSQYDVNGDGALNDYITVESPPSTTLQNVRTLKVPADNPAPDGATLPAGLIDYDVQVATPGDRADVKLYLPDGTLSHVYMFQKTVDRLRRPTRRSTTAPTR